MSLLYLKKNAPICSVTQDLMAKLYGGKGYLSKALATNLFDKGVVLITTVPKNMKAKAISLWGSAMLSNSLLLK
jgi:hypothetical protein